MTDLSAIADLLRELIARVDSLSTALSTRVDSRRRQYQAEWARKKRAAARTTPPSETAASTGPSTVDAVSTGVDNALYPRKDSSEDLSIERKKVSKRVRARARRVPMPEGWRPPGLDYQSEFVEFERFRNHAIANGRICAGLIGWEAAWRNWKSKSAEFNRGGRVNGQRLPRPGSWEDRQEKTANALAKLDQYLARDRDEPGPGGDAGEAPDGRLPFDKSA